MKKYIVIGGEIPSANDNDNDTRYISAHKLCELYGIDPEDCYLAEESAPESLEQLPGSLSHTIQEHIRQTDDEECMGNRNFIIDNDTWLLIYVLRPLLYGNYELYTNDC